tara:strand:+ start:82 stop:1683 length:1602 start_codon:yes stop_codon:yes gene_type:complete
MNYKKFYVSFFLLASIVFSQESIPFEISKQFAVPLENNQLIWNSDLSFNNLLIDRSSRNFKNKFEKLSFEVLPEDSSYVKSKFVYEFGDYGYDKLRVGLKKHSLNETFQFTGSKKSYFGKYSEFSNAENPPVSLFYKFDYSKKFEKNKLYSSVGYFREESQFNFNSAEFDSSLNSEFSDFLSITIGNKFIKNDYNFDLQLNHISKFESLLLNEYNINNKYDLERNRLKASIQKNNFLALNVFLNNSHYFDERSSNGFSLNALTITGQYYPFPAGEFVYGIDLIENSVKPNIYYKNIFGNLDVVFKLRNQHSMVLFDVYDFDGEGRFRGNQVEEWRNLSLTYNFNTKIDFSASLKYVEADNFIVPTELGEVFIPESDRYEFIDDDMVSFQSNFKIPLKYGSLNFNHSYNFYDSLISSNRTHIFHLDYLYNLSLVKNNLGINGKLSLQYMSKNNSDYSFNYFKNMPEKKNNIDSDDYINISLNTEISISDVILTIRIQNALNKFYTNEEYSLRNHEYFNPISSLLTFGVIWEFDD